jgi:dihydropyrimidinase
MMKVDCTIKNCSIVKPDRIIKAGIAIQDGCIAMIAPDEMLPGAIREIDAGGKYVLPGRIDPHVHVDWPDWDFGEGTVSTTKAAAAGGVTTIINFLSGAESLVNIFQEKKPLVEKHTLVDAALHMGVFTEGQIEEIPKMARLGVPSFKFFLPYRGSEVVPPLVGIDDGIVYTAFEEIAHLGTPAIALVHAENIEIFFKLKARVIREGKDTGIHWEDVRPVPLEVESIRRTAYFSEVTGCPVYIVHLSSREGAEEIRHARAQGVPITSETCPQYLTLTADDVDRVLGKVNPPLRRDRTHNEALWEALEEGTVECIGSDHAPCAKKHKQEFWSATVGFAGIQTALPVLLSEGVNRGRVPITKIAEVCSYNVANTFGLLPNKGLIEVGADADLVIVDLKKKFTVRAGDLYHISDFTPYEGKELTGCPVLTMVRGTVVMENGEITAPPGTGRFVPRFVE